MSCVHVHVDDIKEETDADSNTTRQPLQAGLSGRIRRQAHKYKFSNALITLWLILCPATVTRPNKLS
ncbi:hypothetical protein BDZ91DRAFT_715378, partial [Kalaharituber pfeilii]